MSLACKGKTEATSFGAKLRAARAILNWSQTELARRAGLTQRSIHRIEKAGDSEIRHATYSAIQEALSDAGIKFAELPDGGFTMKVPGQTLKSLKHG